MRTITIILIISVSINILGAIAGYKAYKMLKLSKEMYDIYITLRRDIPGLRFYNNANEEISGGKSNSRVVFLGASVTKRWDLQKYFNDPDYINRGVGGQLAPQLLARLYQDAVELHPRAVVIELCAINALPNVNPQAAKYAVHSMVDLCEVNGIEPILTTTLPISRAYEQAHEGGDMTSRLIDLNRWIENFAQKNDIKLINYFNSLSADDNYIRPELTEDGIHPNEKGYELMAELTRLILAQLDNSITDKVDASIQ
ncbi:MAG: hypothetical protein GF315_15030 [candidate division Zixibacteria bacterium]|nr:hypothetical protein [candidate division Zixibacteria bacterium]